MGVSQYTLELMAKVVSDAGKIQKDIDSITSKINAKINLDVTGGTTIKDVQQRFENIRNTADKLAQLTATSRDGLGNVNQYSLKYMDEAKNKYNEIWKLEEKVDAAGKKSSEWKLTEQKAIDGILIREKERLKLEKDLEKLKEKNNLLNVKALEGMDASSKKAESFLAKYEFMTPSPQGDKLKQLAVGIKDAASSGNIQQVNKLSREFDVLKGTLSAATGESYNLGKEMGAVIRRTLESAATLGLMYGALNQLRQGVQYIKDLDKELTNVQVVTGMSQESVESLAMGYNDLAKEMGVTTLEVAKGSLEWIRQGKTAEQAAELVKSSMVLSKLGNLDAAQSTEYLTSVMNGFKLEAKDSMGVIDKIIGLDNSFASSAGEISSALQRSSVSAQQAGVSFEELASMITVVSDVSRRAPESIGEAFPAYWVEAL